LTRAENWLLPQFILSPEAGGRKEEQEQEEEENLVLPVKKLMVWERQLHCWYGEDKPCSGSQNASFLQWPLGTDTRTC
jgi:hypothetical protein